MGERREKGTSNRKGSSTGSLIELCLLLLLYFHSHAKHCILVFPSLFFEFRLAQT